MIFSPPPTTKPHPLYLLPLAHDPTMSYIGWVQAGGAWPSFSNLSKSLSAAHASAVTWRLSICVFLAFYVGFPLVFRSIQELGLV